MFSFETNQLQVQFTDESTNANTWEWSFGDNAFIPSTSTEQNPSFTYSQDGQYTVSLTVTNACGVSTYETTVNVTTTNLNENYKDLTNIYPNPTSNFINIENIQNSEINIYDVNGKLVYSKFIKENKLVLDIKDWANGIYFIKTPTTSQSFIKE
jgi:PKD repeat protein